MGVERERDSEYDIFIFGVYLPTSDKEHNKFDIELYVFKKVMN